MKKLLIFLAVATLSTISFAQRRTLAEAQAIAAEYMDGTQPTAVKHKRASLNNIQSSTSPLYIFSRGANKGFVIVSGSKQLPEIIGYTDNGDYDEDNLPPALQDMLDYYALSAATADEGQGSEFSEETAGKVQFRAAGKKDIAPLMTTHWHQSGPYNDRCPFIKNTTNRALTGCVATAASQVIYYWRKDLGNKTKYNTPTYGYGDAPVTESIPSGTPLKWDLMQDQYGGGEPDECRAAVATLVACVGASNWLTYGSSTSGQINDSRNVFSAQFGLAGGTCVWHDNYSQDTWEKMIISDLELGRPILYSGVHPDNGGHAVVVDGYRLSGNLFHFNFGWGGQGDGYYTVNGTNGMNGFNATQGMVYQVYPTKPNLSGVLTSTPSEIISRVPNTVTARVTNNGTLPYTGIRVYCLSGTAKPNSSSMKQDEDNQTVIEPGESKEFTFSISPTSVSTYNIFLTDANCNVINQVSAVPCVASLADFTLLKLSVEDGGSTETITDNGVQQTVYHIYTTKRASVTATMHNGKAGTLCAPNVQGILYKHNGNEFEQQSTKTQKSPTLDIDATGDIAYAFTGLTDGAVYKFKLAGTATTNKQTDIANADQAIYFKLMGSNLAAAPTEDPTEVRITGNFNSTAMEALCQDANVARYDVTKVMGLKNNLTAANKNALFYADASQLVAGRNIVVDNVCAELDLTPGHNFQPREDFHAMQATYHATQAICQWGTAVLPFSAPTPIGMFARKVDAINTGYLTKVDSCSLQMFSCTPYLIMTATAEDIVASNVAVSINQQSQGTDIIRGTFVNMQASDTHYVLDNADTQYFSLASGTTIPALTAYLDYTRKVRANSGDYSTKDKKARSLAEQIATADAALQQYASTTSAYAQRQLKAVITTAKDSLRNQPVADLQTEQINLLKTATEAYIASAVYIADNGLIDKTSCIVNPSFETGTSKGWTIKSASTKKINSGLSEFMSGGDGICVSSLSAGGNIKQEVSGLPNGTYQLAVAVAADYGKNISITAGEKTQEFASADFGPMYFNEAVIDGIRVEEGTLTIGASATDGWAKVDNFRLYLIEADYDGIHDVQNDLHKEQSMKSGIFDLQGRRLNAIPQHGFYIQNGKKYIK